jgi:hypothetical protein
MNGRAGWLVLPVLAAHLLLLAPRPRTVQTTPSRALPFLTRRVPAAPPPLPLRLPPPPSAPAIPTPPQARPPGRVVQRTAAAHAPAASSIAPTAAPPASPAPAIPPLAIPAPIRLHYEVVAQVRGVTVQGEARFAWRHDGQAYEATLEIEGPGLPTRTQRSTGQLTPAGLAPGYFVDKARGEQATHFDRDQGRLVFSNNRPQAALAEGMQDSLSVIVQLAALLAGDASRYPPGTHIAIPTAGTRQAQAWIFDVQGEEDLLLPGGEVHALRLQRQPRGAYDQRLELWLAPRMDYAPVRLRLTNPDGGVVEQRWASTDRG